ncbi:hypothetical protein PF010_g32081 [Phytophthora fragariae]|uniref:RxLR effector protein n=1 Tax=Phytophthora fragariae TaxID=53985 RepID=A0A6A3V8C2_9STRA|nr:hypothetical protein PF010_g32081 [Phytophthora fragariae]KAE9161424.1 hypothetical protein PF002_g32376 [Phytophthora fragariae]KAE9263081.1 hypothetical protein PF008_g32450 [Phytophthora fragariae]
MRVATLASWCLSAALVRWCGWPLCGRASPRLRQLSSLWTMSFVTTASPRLS